MSRTPYRVGVALTKCYFCGKDDKIVLNQRLTETHAKSVESMHGKIIDMDPCTECGDLMKRGIMILVVDDSKSPDGWERERVPNPFRTGHVVVITEDAAKRLITDEGLLNSVLKHRFTFMAYDAAVKTGLVKP